MATIDPEKVRTLRAFWERLWLPFAVDFPMRDRLLQDLFQAYSQPDRHYHNLNHIHHILQLVWEWRSSPIDFTSVQFAAWFHDAIYDPRAPENEARSAAYADVKLAEMGLGKATRDRVVSLILCTQFHQVLNDGIESQILLDADLAILGSSRAEYQTYARAIRQEYFWVGAAEYRSGRTQVLNQFAQRDRLYCLDRYVVRFEKQARQNINRELLELNST